MNKKVIIGGAIVLIAIAVILYIKEDPRLAPEGTRSNYYCACDITASVRPGTYIIEAFSDETDAAGQTYPPCGSSFPICGGSCDGTIRLSGQTESQIVTGTCKGYTSKQDPHSEKRWPGSPISAN